MIKVSRRKVKGIYTNISGIPDVVSKKEIAKTIQRFERDVHTLTIREHSILEYWKRKYQEPEKEYQLVEKTYIESNGKDFVVAPINTYYTKNGKR